MTTITTVGYGDMYPVTPLGRMVAAALMMCGIAVLGVVTASIASWLVQRVEDTAETAADAVEEPVCGSGRVGRGNRRTPAGSLLSLRTAAPSSPSAGRQVEGAAKRE